MTNQSPTWHLFAWQGIQLEVPERWNPGIIEGTKQSGYCRLDDGRHIRLELRWGIAPTVQPASKLVDSYLDSLQRDLRKKGRTLATRRNVSLATVAHADSECFESHHKPREFGMAVQCNKCRRYAIIRIYAATQDKSAKAVASRILSSYNDEPINGATPWSLYGFRFTVPAEYALASSATKAGRVEFSFGAPRKAIRTVRLSLAEMVLRKHSLLEWLKNDTRKQLRLWGMRWESLSDAPFQTVRGAGRRLGVGRLLGQSGGIVRCRAWHCPTSNAIYAAHWRGPARESAQFDAFADSLRTSQL